MRISDLVLHNDHQLVVLHKPAGMPVQEDPSGDASLHRIAQAYCKRDLHLINRLDRPCSGLVVMAKTAQSAAHLSSQWQSRTVTKKYLAIIPPGVSPATGILRHLITREDRKSTASDPSDSTEANAELSYKICCELDSLTVIEVTTHTGLFHQIRAQLSAIGFPIRGDVKYGARRANKDRTIGLHCLETCLVHPGSQQLMTFQCPLPEHDIWPAVADACRAQGYATTSQTP